MKNLTEFEELIELYESLTIEDINKEWNDHDPSDEILGKITGFGNPYTCTLCIAVGQNTAKLGKRVCHKCVYGEYYKECDVDSEYFYPCCLDETYDNLEHCDTPEEMLERVNQRAIYMKSILKSLNK